MHMKWTVAVVLQLSTAFAGDQNLRAQVERRLAVLSDLRNGGFPVPLIGELARAVPPGAVLSRIAFDADRGELSFALSAGSRMDAEAITAALVRAKACASPAVTEAPVTATCALKPKPRTKSLKAAIDARPNDDPGEMHELRQLIDNTKNELPDAPQLEGLKALFADLSTKAGAATQPPELGTPTAKGPVDVYPLLLRGTAGFDRAWTLMLNISNLHRIVWIDAFELTAPKLKNGEWVVTFSIRGRFFRYRVEEEATAQDLTLNAHASSGVLYAAIPRNPFGPAAPVFAGSAKVPAATACRAEESVTPLGALELDELAVVYVAEGATPRCAMAVDDGGGCHVLALKGQVESAAGAKVSQIGPGAITFTRYVMEPTGKLRKVDVALKVATKAKPPAWFCQSK